MDYAPIIILGVVIAVFYALMILPQQKKMKAHRELIEGLKDGDQVITIGGLYGTIKGTNADKINLEVSKGVEITFARQAISAKVEPKAEEKSEG